MRRIFQAEKLEECVAPSCDNIIRFSVEHYGYFVAWAIMMAGIPGWLLLACVLAS